MFSIVLAEYLAWHGVGPNRGFARVRRGTEGGGGQYEIGSHDDDDDTKNLIGSLSLFFSVFDTGVDSVKMISPVTLLELRIDPILISRLKLIVLQVFSFFFFYPVLSLSLSLFRALLLTWEES